MKCKHFSKEILTNLYLFFIIFILFHYLYSFHFFMENGWDVKKFLCFWNGGVLHIRKVKICVLASF